MTLLDAINFTIAQGCRDILLTPKQFQTVRRALHISTPPGAIKPSNGTLKYRGTTISTLKQE